MKKVFRKIAFMCAVLAMGSAILILAATITIMKICYSDDYLLELVGVNPKVTYQSFDIER
jgi:hypothetical protein